MDAMIGDTGAIMFGPFRLDPMRRHVSRDGSAIVMPAKQFDLLLYLVRNPGRVVGKDELLSAVWGDRIVEEGNLTQAISRLRRVLDDGSDESYILTVSGMGYRFACEVCSANAAVGDGGATSSSPRAPEPRGNRLNLLVAAGLATLFILALGAAISLRGLHAPPPVPPPAASAFNPPPHSVAVMAFTNLSGDPAQEYFSDGLSEELIDALGRIGTLHVPARLSSFSFKGKPATVQEIARALNVGTLLEGSVRRGANGLRVTAQLIDAATGYQIWSNSFDQDAGDVLIIQAKIAHAVAQALNVTLVGDDATKLGLGSTTNPKAFDAYLRGMKLHNDRTPESIRGALAAFNQALALDPNYALAHVRRISCWILIEEGFGVHEPSDPDDKTILANAVAEARQAVSLAPELGPAHTILGNALEASGNFAAAGAEQAAALKLAPQDAWVNEMYAIYQDFVGNREAALAAARHGTELDPLSVEALINLAQVAIAVREPVEALHVLGRATQLGYSGPEYLRLHERALLLAGDTELARQECEAEPSSYSVQCLAIAYHRLGRTRDAEQQLAKIRAAYGDAGAVIYACIYAQWNQPNDALAWLNTASARHDLALIEINIQWELDPVSKSAQFIRIRQAMNFSP